MAGEQSSESLHDRRITWGLMAIVVAFVLLMTCIVLWITTSLIRNETGRSDQSTPSPSNTLLRYSETPELFTDTPELLTNTPDQLLEIPTITPETPQGPILVDATWTSVPKRKYVKFVYWFVKPNSITVGECIQLTWEIEYAVSLKLYRDGKLLLKNPPPKTTLQDCPTKLGYVVYRMVGTSSAGNSNWIQLQVRVKEKP